MELPPGHTEVGEAVADIVNEEFTITVTVAVPVHPLVVPVTV